MLRGDRDGAPAVARRGRSGVPDGAGNAVEVLHPARARSSRELPIWVTAAGSPETFRAAGELGANVLTHLLGQTIEELAEKIAVYRAACGRHGARRPRARSR